jgi:hypothetical protein
MATYTPPPYFPQSSLAPPDPNRYKKFKLFIAAAVIIVVGVVTGIGFGMWYLFRWLF